MSTPQLRDQPGFTSTDTFITKKRGFPKVAIHYELIGCALSGHRLIGGDVATITSADNRVVRADNADGLRWHRCLRCDAWLPRKVASEFTFEKMPQLDRIKIPIRGKILRDKYILRLISLNKVVHCVFVGSLTVLLLYYSLHRDSLHGQVIAVLDSVRTLFGNNTSTPPTKGIFKILYDGVNSSVRTTLALAAALGFYACLSLIEAVGLWATKRWAEYITFLATSLFLIPECYELSQGVSVTKIAALIINLIIVAYLLFAKRLFGLRGGHAAEEEEKNRDIGWPALYSVYP